MSADDAEYQPASEHSKEAYQLDHCKSLGLQNILLHSVTEEELCCVR